MSDVNEMNLNPSATHPSTLGLTWGMRRSESSSALGRRPVRESKGEGLGYQSFTVSTQGRNSELCLLFDTSGRLWGVESTLYMSRDFWNEDYTPEEVESLTNQAEAVYRQAVERSVSLLGPASYSGEYGDEGYPEDETPWKITFWDTARDRWVVSLDHADRELPITVSATWHASHPRAVTPDLPPDEGIRREDKRFFDSLGAESTARTCKQDGCRRGVVPMSVFCRVHHFEQVTGRKCPFND